MLQCFEIMDRDFLPSSVVIWTTVWVFFVFESVCKIVLNDSGVFLTAAQTNQQATYKSISSSFKGHHGHSHGRKESSGERAAARPIYRPKIEHTDSIEVDCFLPKSFDNSNGKAESSLMESLPVTSNTKLNKDNKVRL
jgi:hypothetical protein